MSNFANRHIGSNSSEQVSMLEKIGVSSMDELIDKTIPAHIRLKNDLKLDAEHSEAEYLGHITSLAKKNQVFDSYIGLGYNGTIVPSVILRNVLENPGWYTAYTPYQAEISQGRLEALLNFQTMVLDLTQMEIANASLLDEATAAAECMIMFYNSRSRAEVKEGKNDFFIDKNAFPQTIDIVLGRAENLGINVTIGNPSDFEFSSSFFGAILQYPDQNGIAVNYKSFVQKSHENGIKVGFGADILSLALLTAPGTWGADCVFGTTQRFGVPMGYGGPHAAYFACKETYKRVIPGRIIGVSKDADGNQALRMALQTREQHIKRDKATSNICTAQALLAVMASMYAVYHGPAGVKKIAKETHGKAVFIKEILHGYGIQIKSNSYFDTISGKIPADKKMSKLKELMVDNNINLRYINDFEFSLSLNEAIDILQINKLLDVFATFLEKEFVGNSHIDWTSYWDLKPELTRNGEILTHEIFSQYHSESKMMRYLKRLENKDLSLVHSMIPLGSCTMKLNAASELIPITMPEFANIHPFAPLDQTVGYLEMINQLEEDLCEITGFDAVSFQPNSGAQGEYAGLMVIKAFHESNGHLGRNIVLIPSSAHGTNPASAVMAGMKVVVVKCDDLGNIDVVDLKEKAELYSNELSALMVTYPSTHGVFEESIIEVTQIIHDNGGQVYMDGANMNAQVGLTNPGNIGADVCHLNLHKTFAIPHGGGGPGVGPIGVAKHLSPFLPTNALIKTGGEHAIKGVSSAPFGSSLILLISYGYIKMLGAKGLRASTENAILNANYIKASLADHYDVLYSGVNGTVAHEMILDCRSFKKTTGVEVADIAKRLIDYGFHAPTVSFPVAGTLMIEPTESEDKDELDRFIDSMIAIRKEIAEIEAGKFDHDNNLLKNAPHTAGMLTADSWELPYSRKQASYPAAHLSTWKYWVPVRRVDNAFGDRNLICSCPSIEEYENMLAN